MRRTARASCSRRDPLFLVLQSQFWFVILPEASSGERALCGTGSGRRPRASRIPFRSSHLGILSAARGHLSAATNKTQADTLRLRGCRRRQRAALRRRANPRLSVMSLGPRGASGHMLSLRAARRTFRISGRNIRVASLIGAFLGKKAPVDRGTRELNSG